MGSCVSHSCGPSDHGLAIPRNWRRGSVFGATTWRWSSVAEIRWRTQAEIDAERDAQAWAARRAERNRRLAETDWLMLPDAPVPRDTTREQGAAYRQALRDVPQQPGAPWNVTWPTPPTGDVTEE